MRECPEGWALSAPASTGKKDQTQTCSSRDPSLYCHSPRGGTGSSGQASRIGGGIPAGMGTCPCPWASEHPRLVTAPSMATLTHSPHCHQPHGLLVGSGIWPRAAASPRQGLCRSHHFPGQHYQAPGTESWSIRRGARSSCHLWPVAHSTLLVTDVGTGLEALAHGLKVVPVAAAAAVDEFLTSLAGGIEEEATEERLAVPTD